MSTSSNYPWLERVRRETAAFHGVSAYNNRDFKVFAGDGVEAVSGQFVTGNYHGVLGVRFQLGRGFVSENDRVHTPLAVISDGYWNRRFGRRPDILGESITVGRHTVTIVGVTAEGFEGMQPGRPADVTLPLSLHVADDPEYLTRTDTWTSMPIVARLAPGVDVTRAHDAIASAYRDHMTLPDNRRFSTTRSGEPRVGTLVPAAFGQDRLRTQYERPLHILMAMVVIVLLVGCVNIANLLLTQAPARAREIAVRMSIGGSRAASRGNC